MFGKAQTRNKSFEDRLSAIAGGQAGTMKCQVSAHPDGGGQPRIRAVPGKLALWKLGAAMLAGGAMMILARAGYLRAEPLLGAETPMLTWFLLLLGDLGLAAIAATLAMIALGLNKPALQGALAFGVVAIFAGDAHVAAIFPEAFSAIYTEEYVDRARLDHGPVLQALLAQ